jgi:hypothetical protein
MDLGLDSSIGVFTQLNIVPSVKYFATPNLPYSIYPDMRNEQMKYIENGEVQFIILPGKIYDFNYFFTLPALNRKYTLIDKYEDENNLYYLYKRNE